MVRIVLIYASSVCGLKHGNIWAIKQYFDESICLHMDTSITVRFCNTNFANITLFVYIQSIRPCVDSRCKRYEESISLSIYRECCESYYPTNARQCLHRTSCKSQGGRTKLLMLMATIINPVILPPGYMILLKISFK